MANQLQAALSYLIFFLPLLTGAKNDPFVRYHMKQGLGLFLVAAALRGIITALGGPPYTAIGAQLGYLLIQPAHLFLLVLLVVGVMNATQNKTKPLPLIGEYADRLF